MLLYFMGFILTGKDDKHLELCEADCTVLLMLLDVLDSFSLQHTSDTPGLLTEKIIVMVQYLIKKSFLSAFFQNNKFFVVLNQTSKAL